MLHHTVYKNSNSQEWVCFVHGAGGSSSIWYKQVRDFKQHFNVLLVDLRGHGKSKQPFYDKLKRYTFDHIGNDVMEVIDYLKIEKAHFVGISLGTIIIRELSERFPNRMHSMIMGGAVMKINFRGQLLMRMGVLLKSVIPYLLLYKLFAFVIMPRKNHRESRLLFVNEARKLYQKEFKKWFALASEVNPLLSWFRIQEAKVPSLYVMGAEDHMFLPSISKLVSKHKNTRLEIVENCGHVVNIEQPDVFNKLVIKYLNQFHLTVPV